MDFQKVINQRCEKIKETLCQKNKEYASGHSPFHNFTEAARKQNTTPEKALIGMMTKHTVSIDDLVDTADQNPSKLDIDMINEKIGDEINYLILLEGLLTEKTEHSHASWPEVEFGTDDKTQGHLAQKNALLNEALEQLLACEWEVNVGTIAKIEKELGIE